MDSVIAINAPSRLLIEDIRLIIANLRFVPLILWPLITNVPSSELFFNVPDSLAFGWQAFLAIGSLTVFALVISALVFPILPIQWVSLVLVIYAIIYIVLLRLSGPIIVQSKEPKETKEKKRQEEWFFVNGICVGQKWINENIDLLANIFGRRITGIHNKTFGIFGDIIECLIQRDFNYMTNDARVTYNLVRQALLNERIKRVVLLGHSQGGLIVTLVVDRLLAEMSQDVLAKLEVYTFASFANHFSSPLESSATGHEERGAAQEKTDRAQSPHVIQHVEHFANERDFVSRISVLYFSSRVHQFYGTIFRLPSTGHLLNQHYLNNMFTFQADTNRWVPNPLVMNSQLAQYLNGAVPSF
ncbi:hypothetical protein VKS41_005019 [Umbelopsis sp. WA50703]